MGARAGSGWGTREEAWRCWGRFALQVRHGGGAVQRRKRVGIGIGNEVVIMDRKLRGKRRECEVVEAGRGAILAASAVGVLIIGDVHAGGCLRRTEKGY